MSQRDGGGGGPPFGQDTIDEKIAAETIERYVGTRLSREASDVIVEGRLVITARGSRMVSLTASPGAWDELALGFLFFHGVRVSPANVLSVSIIDEGRGAVVDVGAPPEAIRRALGDSVGFTMTDDHRTVVDIPPEKAGCAGSGVMTPERIFSLMRLMEAHSDVHDRTHGSHIALLVDGEEAVAARSDISRRNAIDKVAGFALINSIPTDGMTLITSGRVASDIVARARLLGVSALISRSAATDRGVQAARDAGLMLVGMVRDGSFLVYSGLGRVGANPKSR
ncbi:MAG: formate dehydrogenase accessory sulfurtransferase FdhD [Deltaproteobacteria bacterium]|nr:formate dehydrogenase accessory sulfurtransferase FdhD [Candidatus Zymogenaceae bacterium]